MRWALATIVTLAVATAPLAAAAQASDPAAQQIETFDAALLNVMKQAKSLGPEGRYQALEPAIERTFDLPTMTRFAVGPTTWQSLTSADQAALVQAFRRMTVATYAHNFNSYSGERFTLENVETRGPDKLVHTRLVSSGGAPVTLVYRVRQSGGTWKAIDVYYNGAISSLTGQRSEYASTLRSGGAAALIKTLNRRADDLLKR
jgi:phospholipid transport system substrate-binding protein